MLKRVCSLVLLLSVALVGILPTRVSAAENPSDLYDHTIIVPQDGVYLDCFSLYYDSWFNFTSARFNESSSLYISHPYFDQSEVNLLFQMTYDCGEVVANKGDRITFKHSFDCRLGNGYVENLKSSDDEFWRVEYLDSSGSWKSLSVIPVISFYYETITFSLNNAYCKADVYGLRFSYYTNIYSSTTASPPLTNFTIPFSVDFLTDYEFYVNDYVPNTSEEMEEEQIEISSNIFDNVVRIVKSLLELPSNIAKRIGGFFSEVVNTISISVGSVLENLSELPNKISWAFSKFFDSILEKLSLIIDSLDSDKGKLDSFLDGKTDAFGNAIGGLDNLEKPNVEDLLPNLEDIFPTDSENYIGRLFGCIWMFEEVKSFLVLTFVFALMAYTFFGKR